MYSGSQSKLNTLKTEARRHAVLQNHRLPRKHSGGLFCNLNDWSKMSNTKRAQLLANGSGFKDRLLTRTQNAVIVFVHLFTHRSQVLTSVDKRERKSVKSVKES